MTTPNQPKPDRAYAVNDGNKFGSLETDAGIRAKVRGGALPGFERGQNNLQGPGGFLGTIISAITQGRGFDLGFLSSFMGGMRADVVQIKDVDVPRLENRINKLGSGSEQAVFGSSGSWTMPANATRIEVHLIGGSPGGHKANGVGGTPYFAGGGGAPGWVRALMIPAANIGTAGTVVAVTIGVGGGGGVNDNQLGAPGGDTTFGTWARASGGRGTSAGPQNGSGTENLGNVGGSIYLQNAGESVNYVKTNGGNGFLCRGGSTVDGRAGEDGEPAPQGSGSFGPGAGGGAGGIPTSAGNGFKGGNGGYPGGPGGSGSAARTFGSSGAGGNGSPGLAVIITHFS